MPPRLSQGYHSFISFYSCSQPLRAQKGRHLSALSTTCLHRKPPGRTVPAARLPLVEGPGRPRCFHATAVSAAPKDPYAVLGVKRDASSSDIKKTYFALARKFHPDTNPDASAREKFQEIQDAYDTLKDDKKRSAYDRYGAASQQDGFDADMFEQASRNPFGASGFGPFSGFGSSFGGNAGGQSELFESLFGAFAGAGGGRSRGFNQPVRGSDIEVNLGLPFIDACKGTTREIETTPLTNCNTCTGSGMKSGAKRMTCTSCGGTGQRTFVIQSGFQMSSTCPTCKGAGTVVPRGNQCGSCSGMGKVRVRKSVKVDIPAGVEDGMTVRVPNGGDVPVQGQGSKGDLLVTVSVASSKQFRRQGPNLYHEARIPLQTALLGGRVRVPTLDGDVDVRVPGGTQQGEEMVLKGHGVQRVMGGERGDIFVEFLVQLPRSLTPRQREILQQYADEVEGRPTQSKAKPSASEGAKAKDPVGASEAKDPEDEHDDANATGTEEKKKARRVAATS